MKYNIKNGGDVILEINTEKLKIIGDENDSDDISLDVNDASQKDKIIKIISVGIKQNLYSNKPADNLKVLAHKIVANNSFNLVQLYLEAINLWMNESNLRDFSLIQENISHLSSSLSKDKSRPEQKQLSDYAYALQLKCRLIRLLLRYIDQRKRSIKYMFNDLRTARADDHASKDSRIADTEEILEELRDLALNVNESDSLAQKFQDSLDRFQKKTDLIHDKKSSLKKIYLKCESILYHNLFLPLEKNEIYARPPSLVIAASPEDRDAIKPKFLSSPYKIKKGIVSKNTFETSPSSPVSPLARINKDFFDPQLKEILGNPKSFYEYVNDCLATRLPKDLAPWRMLKRFYERKLFEKRDPGFLDKMLAQYSQIYLLIQHLDNKDYQPEGSVDYRTKYSEAILLASYLGRFQPDYYDDSFKEKIIQFQNKILERFPVAKKNYDQDIFSDELIAIALKAAKNFRPHSSRANYFYRNWTKKKFTQEAIKTYEASIKSKYLFYAKAGSAEEENVSQTALVARCNIEQFKNFLLARLVAQINAAKILSTDLFATKETTTDYAFSLAATALASIPGAAPLGHVVSTVGKAVNAEDDDKRSKMNTRVNNFIATNRATDRIAIHISEIVTSVYRQQICMLLDSEQIEKFADCACTRIMDGLKKTSDTTDLRFKAVEWVRTSTLKHSLFGFGLTSVAVHGGKHLSVEELFSCVGFAFKESDDNFDYEYKRNFFKEKCGFLYIEDKSWVTKFGKMQKRNALSSPENNIEEKFREIASQTKNEFTPTVETLTPLRSGILDSPPRSPVPTVLTTPRSTDECDVLPRRLDFDAALDRSPSSPILSL